jgi:radical SAM superfamily enzyme YgiQ (UPF0313 family)
MARILFVSDHLANEGLGIMCLSSHLKAHGHDVDLTLLADHPSLDAVVERVAAARPDVVGFSMMTPQVPAFRPVARALKRELGVRIAWGGPHCMYMADDVTRYDYVDWVCIGEGEDPLLELMNRLEAGEPATDVPGLWARVGRDWVKNDTGRLDDDLDRYPFPDRELYYGRYPLLRDFAVKRVMSQRGCPYKCSYCFEPSLAELYEGKGKLVRRRSVANVVAEIRTIVGRYPTRCIHFSDDTFNLSRRWLFEFAEVYGREIDVPFTCNVTVQNLDEELVRRLADAGCRGMVCGLESGVEETRATVLDKPIPNQTYLEVSRMLRRHRIRFMTNIMFGLPHESLDDAIESIRFNKALRPLGTRVAILKPYKGTQLARRAIADGIAVAEGEFMIGIRDTTGDLDDIKNMVWAGYLFVKVPFLIHLARFVLRWRRPGPLRHLVLLSNLQEVLLYRIPPWQALRFFWASRHVFLGGMGKDQAEAASGAPSLAPTEAPAGRS